MSLMNGVVIGLVTDVNGKGMVKVKFPWLPDEPETDWIRIATTMAGDKRGTFFMPEKKDEVLIAFEHGDTNHPYVVGFLWNGQDKPPEKDKNIRMIKTKSGHTVEFNDNPTQEKIVIESQGKQKIEMKDRPLGNITIKTKAGNIIEIDETSGGSISLTALNGISLSAPDIKLSAAASLQISSPTFSHAAGVTNISGAVNFSIGPLIIAAPTSITGVTSITGATTIVGASTLPVLSGSKLVIT